MNDFKDKRESFQSSLNPINDETSNENQYKFDPNSTAKEIMNEQLLEFARLLKGTQNEELIAYKDPKVQELVNYILTTIILENERINKDSFPLSIYSRYKSDNSLENKLIDYASRDDKQDTQISDYLGIRVVPETEHSIFFSDGDLELQKMIDKREAVRTFISEKYKELSENPNVTFKVYCDRCKEILLTLKNIFPEEAVERKKYYDELISSLKDSFLEYTGTVEYADEPIDFKEISEITGINIMELLSELSLQNPNEVTLHKLTSDLINTFNTSELLRALRCNSCAI